MSSRAPNERVYVLFTFFGIDPRAYLDTFFIGNSVAKVSAWDFGQNFKLFSKMIDFSYFGTKWKGVI